MRWYKNNLPAILLDLIVVTASWWLAFWLRFNLDIPPEFQSLVAHTLHWPLLSFGISLLGWGVYRHIWRYTSVAELTRLVYGVVFGSLLTAFAVLMLRVESFPRTVLLLQPVLALVLLGAVRVAARMVFTHRSSRGATLAGKPLKATPKHNPHRAKCA